MTLKASNYFQPTLDGRIIEKLNSTSTDINYIDNLNDTITTPIYAYQSVPIVVNGTTQIKYLQTMRAETIAAAQKITPFMAIADDGVYTWGLGNYGQIGVNNTSNAITPTSIGFKPNQISYNLNTAIGLDLNGYAWTWGLNNNGQLGNNTINNSSSPVSVIGGNQFVTVSNMAGADGFIGVDMSGFAWSWGDNTNGNLGDGTTINRSSPVSVVLNSNNFVSVEGSCAIDINGYCWSWGANSIGQVGDGTTNNKSNPVLIVGGINFDGKIYTIANGDFFKLALTTDGYCYAWGDNTYGTLGDGTTTNKSSPVSVLGGHKFIKIAADSTHALALDINGVVWAWGANINGQLGNNSINHSSSPISINQGQIKFVDIDVGSRTVNTNIIIPTVNKLSGSDYGSASFLDQSSYAWGWGSNAYGQIGNNTTSDNSFPVSIVGGKRFSFFRIGDLASVALDLAGYAWAWGYNFVGALGDNTLNYRSSPVSVVGGKKWLKVVSSNSNAYGIDISSYVWAWGSNSYNGQVGDGTMIARSSPVSVIGGLQAMDIALSLDSAVMLDISSNAWIWGTFVSPRSSSPVSVVGNKKFVSISSNQSNFFALDASSYLWSWGTNTNGSLGNGTIDGTYSPVSVIGNRRFIKIATNPDLRATHFAALDGNSQIWAWGVNANGNLGDGTTIDRSSPISVLCGPCVDITLGANTLLGIPQNPSYSYFVCGYNNNNIMQLNATPAAYSSPIIASVKVTTDSSIALSSDGNICVWGYLDGDISKKQMSVPYSIFPDYKFKVN